MPLSSRHVCHAREISSTTTCTLLLNSLSIFLWPNHHNNMLFTLRPEKPFTQIFVTLGARTYGVAPARLHCCSINDPKTAAFVDEPRRLTRFSRVFSLALTTTTERNRSLRQTPPTTQSINMKPSSAHEEVLLMTVPLQQHNKQASRS